MASGSTDPGQNEKTTSKVGSLPDSLSTKKEEQRDDDKLAKTKQREKMKIRRRQAAEIKQINALALEP